jgi:PHAX RNA-binding domain-containing protein
VPKIDVEPHPRGRFGPATTIKNMASEATIQTISKALGEADEGPLAQIQAVVDALGEETSLSLLAETDRIEKAGGMERGDGKGRRSPGGVFFYLARQKLPKEQRAAIFNDKMPREPKPPGFVPEQKRGNDSERSFPRRRVFEVNPGSSRPGSSSGSASSGGRPLGSGPGSSRGQWSPPPLPSGVHVPPQLPNAIARGRAKLGILDALGSLHPDDQYLVLLELLGDLHAVYGASADTAAPDSKSIPESKSTPTVAAAARVAVEVAPSSSEPPPSPKRKAPARKSAKSG